MLIEEAFVFEHYYLLGRILVKRYLALFEGMSLNPDKFFVTFSQ